MLTPFFSFSLTTTMFSMLCFSWCHVMLYDMPCVCSSTIILHTAQVYNDGRICIDILKSQWSPIYDITNILISIQSLLGDPNPNSPANEEAASLYRDNRREYSRRVHALVAENLAASAEASSSSSSSSSSAAKTDA